MCKLKKALLSANKIQTVKNLKNYTFCLSNELLYFSAHAYLLILGVAFSTRPSFLLLIWKPAMWRKKVVLKWEYEKEILSFVQFWGEKPILAAWFIYTAIKELYIEDQRQNNVALLKNSRQSQCNGSLSIKKTLALRKHTFLYSCYLSDKFHTNCRPNTCSHGGSCMQNLTPQKIMKAWAFFRVVKATRLLDDQ